MTVGPLVPRTTLLSCGLTFLLAASSPLALAQTTRPATNSTRPAADSDVTPPKSTGDEDDDGDGDGDGDGDEKAKKPSSSGTESEAGGTDTSKDAPRPTLLGDTSRFTRYSGWGSVGGAMGQWGFAKSALIMMPPVQEELELTEDQKQQLRDWLDSMRQRGEDFGRNLREQRRQNGEDGDPFQNPNASVTQRMSQFTSFMGQVGQLLKENETGIDRILDKAQRKRLTQIALQMEGAAALVRPDVAQAINLSPTQQIEIQQRISYSRNAQMTTWITQMSLMAARRNAARTAEEKKTTEAPASTTRQQPKAAARKDSETDSETPRAPLTDAERQARQKRQQDAQKEFESIRDRTDAIQNQAVTLVLKVLTRRQRANFEKILGEPFDPKKVNNFDRPRQAEGQEPGSTRSRTTTRPADDPDNT
jgi:hypothetical protein